MSTLTEEAPEKELLRAKQMLEAALAIIDRHQVWVAGAQLASAIATIDALLQGDDTFH